LPFVITGLSVVLAATAANVIGFHLLGSSYLRWWVDSGSVISIVFVVLAAATDLDRHPGLISQEPWGFVATLLAACSEITLAWTTTLAPTARDDDLIGGPGSLHRSFLRWRTMDLWLTFLFTAALATFLACWVLVIAPAQYWTNLLCGAPARQALTANQTVWIQTKRVEVSGDAGEETAVVVASRDQTPPLGARVSTLLTKPVSLTAGLAAGTLLALKVLV
jgi:hypothetical protein